MIQLIASIIFVISLGVIFFILARKMPVLAALPKDGHHGIKKHRIILHAETRLRDFHFDFFKKQVYLHKLLSVIKIWTLKAGNQIDHLLHGIRKNAQELEKKTKRRKK